MRSYGPNLITIFFVPAVTPKLLYGLNLILLHSLIINDIGYNNYHNKMIKQAARPYARSSVV